jgi:GH18 family chitinase
MKSLQALCGYTFILFFLVVTVRAQTVNVSAYYPVWRQTTNMPPANINFSQMTYLMHFGTNPIKDSPYFDATISSGQSSALMTARATSPTKILFCVGGVGSQGAFKDIIANNRMTENPFVVKHNEVTGALRVRVDWILT